MAEGLKLRRQRHADLRSWARPRPGTAIEGQRIVGAQPFPAFEAQIKALLGER